MNYRLVLIFIVLLTLLTTSYVFPAESDESPHNDKKSWQYIEQGNHGEPLSKGDFINLISQIDKSLISLKSAVSNISIPGNNISYERGKMLETELQSMKEDIEDASKYLNEVKKNPNTISLSLILYVTLERIVRSGYDFSRLTYDHNLDDTVPDLSLWAVAFQKSHLIPLAVAKDKKKKLYK